MAAAVDPLAELRPIHWPEPVSWWPPAPGWVLLLLVLLLALVMVGAWFIRSRRKPAIEADALQMLTTLEVHAGSDREFLDELNRALKRIALARFPRERVARLTGQPWLAFLATTGGTDAFVSGAGKALEQAPYQASAQLGDRDELLSLCRQWVVTIWRDDETL
jgi:hypothetical protein